MYVNVGITLSLLMFKSIHGLAPNYISNEIIMEIEVNNRITRHNNCNNVYVPFISTNCTRNSFSYQGPILWKYLPDNLKECTSNEMFKRKAKYHFLN